MYENISLVPNSHFYDIPVNTDFSSVHVPTNVYDLSEEALSAIEWSESLDDVFVQNYNSDPALSWQFFGSSSGVMRHYPAMQWMQEVDLFDCRTRSWFIEAATCSKDVVILLDNSGSMTGKLIGYTSNAIFSYSGIPRFYKKLPKKTSIEVDFFEKKPHIAFSVLETSVCVVKIFKR